MKNPNDVRALPSVTCALIFGILGNIAYYHKQPEFAAAGLIAMSVMLAAAHIIIAIGREKS